MKIKLGSDLIECLSWSLYENPIVLFREAIQNSIDAFPHKDRNWQNVLISISLDSTKREISIKDNGPGLSHDDFCERLCTIGESKKKNLNFAGCRGIGRLSGLGICDEIIFNSKVNGSLVESQCIIDAKGIKDGLKNKDQSIDLGEYVGKYIKIIENKKDNHSESYFNVIYKNVVRLAGDNLLNPFQIETYLKNVAPVPFENSNEVVKNIEQFYEKYDLPHSVNITINSGKRIAKTFDNHVLGAQNKELNFLTHEIKSDSEKIIGAAWVLHHDYLGALQPSAFRGLRFRHKNILIGDEDTFSCLFKEPRFNRWTVGEVHPLDTSIRPSVKRDDFEQSQQFGKLIYQLKPELHKISQNARKSSSRRVEEKTQIRMRQQKPLLQKIQKKLKRGLPHNINKTRAIQIAEDIFLVSKGKITPEMICSAFLSNKISI